MEKNGEVTSKSLSDFVGEDGKVKKAEYYDKESNLIADEDNKDKLKTPVALKEKR